MLARLAARCAALACALVLCATSAAADRQGLWENAPAGSEPGWALAIAPNGERIVATWLTYDTDGSPMWLALEGDDLATLLDGYDAGTIYVGELYRAYTGASLASNDPLVPYGPAAIAFDGDNGAVFYYNVDGAWRAKSIERTYFADDGTTCPSGVDGLWSASALPSDDPYAAGVHVAQRGDTVVAAQFGFDALGKATWRVMSATRSGPDSFAGTIYQTRGPSFDSGYEASQFAVTDAGSGTLTFANAAQGMLASVVDGTPSAIAISRLAVPLSSCN